MDGLRVDAVASMLYLDYNRQTANGAPNIYGGRENLEAVDFLRLLNESDSDRPLPTVMMIAEESTAWPMVTKPGYMRRPGLQLQVEHGLDERYAVLCERGSVLPQGYARQDHLLVLCMRFRRIISCPLSHDEVVHGKCSLIDKMPDPYENKFAALRALYGYMTGASRARRCCLWAANSRSSPNGTMQRGAGLDAA